MPDRNNRGVALFIVLSIIIVVMVLTVVILRIISNQSRLTHHQVSRIRAFYADKAAMNLAFDKLRTGAWTQNPTSIVYYCINGKVDAAVTCSDTFTDSSIVDDSGNPRNIQIAVHPAGGSGISNCSKLEIKTTYTYTP